MKKLIFFVKFSIVFFTLIIIASCGSSGGGGNSGPLVLLDDNFDTENGSVGILNYADFANWDISDGTVDLIGNGLFDFIPGNGLYVEMDGSTFDTGKMTTKTSFSLVPGFSYELQFDFAGNQLNNKAEQVTVQVGVGGVVFSETFSLNQDDPFITFTRQFEVSTETNAVISFEGVGDDNIGMLLDNVKLTRL